MSKWQPNTMYKLQESLGCAQTRCAEAESARAWAECYWILGPIAFAVEWGALALFGFMTGQISEGFSRGTTVWFLLFAFAVLLLPWCCNMLLLSMWGARGGSDNWRSDPWNFAGGVFAYALFIRALIIIIPPIVLVANWPGIPEVWAISSGLACIFLGECIFFWLFAPALNGAQEKIEQAREYLESIHVQLSEEQAAKLRWEQHLQELRARKPTTSLAFAERGRDFMEAGLLDEALVNIDAAILMDPDCAEAHLWRGMVLAAQEKEKPKQT